VYALLGTSHQLNVAPEAALSLLVGQAVSDILHGNAHTNSEHDDDEMGMAIATAITVQVNISMLIAFSSRTMSMLLSVQVGLISFLLGFFRLGFIDVVLSRALLRGFVSAVAVVIMMYLSRLAVTLVISLTFYSEQLIPMFGLTARAHENHLLTTLDKIIFLSENVISYMHTHTAVVSFGALLVLVILRSVKNFFHKHWWIYRLPEVLVVVVVSISTFIMSCN
jgi:MFS superfamily sulfate permease-like transporter